MCRIPLNHCLSKLLQICKYPKRNLHALCVYLFTSCFIHQLIRIIKVLKWQGNLDCFVQEKFCNGDGIMRPSWLQVSPHRARTCGLLPQEEDQLLKLIQMLLSKSISTGWSHGISKVLISSIYKWKRNIVDLRRINRAFVNIDVVLVHL